MVSRVNRWAMDRDVELLIPLSITCVSLTAFVCTFVRVVIQMVRIHMEGEGEEECDVERMSFFNQEVRPTGGK